MFRSLMAVLAGYVTVAILTMAATLVATRAIIAVEDPGPNTPDRTVLLLGITLSASVLAAIAGGFIAGSIASQAQSRHALALAGTLLFLGMLSASQPHPGYPIWYGWLLAPVVASGALIGGAISATRVSRKREAQRTRAAGA